MHSVQSSVSVKKFVMIAFALFAVQSVDAQTYGAESSMAPAAAPAQGTPQLPPMKCRPRPSSSLMDASNRPAKPPCKVYVPVSSPAKAPQSACDGNCVNQPSAPMPVPVPSTSPSAAPGYGAPAAIPSPAPQPSQSPAAPAGYGAPATNPSPAPVPSSSPSSAPAPKAPCPDSGAPTPVPVGNSNTAPVPAPKPQPSPAPAPVPQPKPASPSPFTPPSVSPKASPAAPCPTDSPSKGGQSPSPSPSKGSPSPSPSPAPSQSGDAPCPSTQAGAGKSGNVTAAPAYNQTVSKNMTAPVAVNNNTAPVNIPAQKPGSAGTPPANAPAYGKSPSPDAGKTNAPAYGSSPSPDAGKANAPAYGNNTSPDAGKTNAPAYKQDSPAQQNAPAYKKDDKQQANAPAYNNQDDKKSDQQQNAPAYNKDSPSPGPANAPAYAPKPPSDNKTPNAPAYGGAIEWDYDHSQQSCSEKNNGGTMQVPGAAEFKKASFEGLASECGEGEPIKTFYIGGATVETTCTKNWPTEQNQKDIGKLGQESQEIGPLRMNIKHLTDFGYDMSDINIMNQPNAAGYKLAAQAFCKAVKAQGIYGFIVYHRGGITRYNKWKSGELTADEKKDTDHFLDSYRQAQKEADIKGLTKIDDTVPFLQQGPMAI
ncbi:hypothetical protein MP228_007852 [Amoeboaphelidium protococcarum]|nr:hypothetical protein MP228_007852 [Amoeboaphelidium protococcarum]